MKLKRPLPSFITFTQEGLYALKKELEELERKRPAAVAELQRGRELGDLSENGLYKAAKAQLRSIDSRIERLQYSIKMAKVVTPSNTGVVEVGSKVIVKTNGEEKVFYIVGDFEADPGKSKISQHSPIGKALLGKKIGESVELTVPSGKVLFSIKAIE